MIKLVLIDDEPNSLRNLEWEINNFSKDFEIIATFTNPEEGISFLRRNKVDCVFIDIEMPQMDGFQFLKSFHYRDFIPVIVTAYAQYALKAIKEEAFDYLLKPIDIEDLILTLDKIKLKLKNKSENHSTSLLHSKIGLPVNGKIVYTPPEDILYCESDGNYTKIFFTNGENLFVTKKIKNIQEFLPETLFARVHNSYVINMQKVKEFLKTDHYVVLENGKMNPVSRNKRDLFLGIS